MTWNRATTSVAVAWLLAVNLTAATAQTTAVIKGPEKSALGDLVILDGSQSQNATVLHWLLIGSDKTFLPVDDGKRVVFASGTPGNYRFVLVAAGPDGNGGLSIGVAEHTITLGTPPPDPNPPNPNPPKPNPPNPNPPSPDPDFPDGEYQLAAWSYKKASELPASARAKATELADCFESLAARINPPDFNVEPIKNVEELVKLTVECNRQAAGDERENWLPFFQAMDQKLTELSNSGELTSLDQHKTAWQEIAAGLRAVK